MRILLALNLVTIIAFLISIVEIWKTIIEYEKFIEDLNDIIRKKNKEITDSKDSLLRIKTLARECQGNQFYGNTSIGFRQIEELTEKNTAKKAVNKIK